MKTVTVTITIPEHVRNALAGLPDKKGIGRTPIRSILAVVGTMPDGTCRWCSGFAPTHKAGCELKEALRVLQILAELCDPRPQAAPVRCRCSLCNRAGWDVHLVGAECGMIQPDGSRCSGRFVR